ncbi:MAG: hypothetical protein ACRBBM_06580, partial [Pseudomonadaceae bacterium]
AMMAMLRRFSITMDILGGQAVARLTEKRGGHYTDPRVTVYVFCTKCGFYSPAGARITKPEHYRPRCFKAGLVGG